MYKYAKSKYDIQKDTIYFSQKSVFFSEISRDLLKISTLDIPTAEISYNKETDQFTLAYNPEYMLKHTYRQRLGIILHEIDHLALGHLTLRRKELMMAWNLATDLAINSLIKRCPPNVALEKDELESSLLENGLIPGQIPKYNGKTLTPEEAKAIPLAHLISTFPPLQSAEWYYERIKEVLEKEKKNNDDEDGSNPLDGFETLDNHNGWENVDEQTSQRIKEKVKKLLTKAVNAAEESNADTAWGNVPNEMREEIKSLISQKVDWFNILKYFVSSLSCNEKRRSLKKINRKYPWVHPGIKRKRVAKLVIYIDQSASMANEFIELIFSRLQDLAHRVSIDVYPFDTEVSEKNHISWKKGQKIKFERSLNGGTNFNAPTQHANSLENRGKWDAMIIATDGECSKPEDSRLKRAWLLPEGCSLTFKSDDLQIALEDLEVIT